MKILGIDTSSVLFSLCLNEDNRVLYEIRKNREVEGKSRDALFFIEAKKLLDYLKGERLGAIAVCIGPGMFTSLRVGMSFAKGLAIAQNVPIVGINSLDAMGIPASFLFEPVLAVINAYHQEIYAALYKKGKKIGNYLLTTPEKIIKIIQGNVFVIGSGIEVIKYSKQPIHTNKLNFINSDFLLPTASKIISIALARIRKGNFDNPDTLEPYYIKKTNAERNHNKGNEL